MDTPLLFAFLLAVSAAIGAGLGIGWLLALRAGALGDSDDHQLTVAVERAVEAVRSERSEALQVTVDTVLSVASSKLGDQLAAGKLVMDREREVVGMQVDAVSTELRRIGDLVANLQNENAQQQGRLVTGLEQAFQVTSSLASTTQSLERALASPKARGQWGERMAEDVLSAAGFVDGVNYRKQTKAERGGIPDYTFLLPHGHVVHMDVKFPIDNYRRWLDADHDQAKTRCARDFQRDVRQRIKELAERSYVDPETTVDYVLLFVPNESVYGFLHEHDGAVIDVALAQKVVLCSPTTLFAVLAVIRQSVDNFLTERRSDEILGSLGALREQWDRWREPMEKMARGLSSAQRAYDELAGPRTRQFERQLRKLETVRTDRLDDVEAPTDTVTAAEPGARLDCDLHFDRDLHVEEADAANSNPPQLPLRQVV